jgi:hypothetical protein
MERLPYIDEHATTVEADAATTWAALLRIICREPADPSTVPFGFVLDEATPPTRFALKGRHWFSTYRLIFVLSDVSHDTTHSRTRVVAESWARFPGVLGTVYRTLVIGSGGHRIVVRRLLKRIAAESLPLSIAAT